MANTWYRQYAEFAHDPKVQMLPEAMQRRLVMLFCLRCEESLETLQETEIAFQLRITETDLSETKALFVEKGFIDDEWNLVNWNKRQFLSDSSTERVRRHRQAKKQPETFHETQATNAKRNSDVTVTAPEQMQKIPEKETEEKEAREKTPPSRLTAAYPSAGANGEFMFATELGKEIKLAMRPGDIALVAQVIANEADEHGGPMEAKNFIRDKALEARARGDLVTVFWLQDRRFAQVEEDQYAKYMRGV